MEGNTDDAQDRRTDEELMEAHARGDEGAFSELFRRWAGRIFGFLRHMSGDRELALDLVQETFVRVHRARARFDPDRPFRPWLFRIASRVQADMGRSWYWKLRKRTVSLFGGEGGDALPLADRIAADRAGEPPRVAEARETTERIRREVGSLPEPYRQAVILHDLEGMTAREIAAVTGRPMGTVLSWMHRGHALLRERLARAGGKGEWS